MFLYNHLKQKFHNWLKYNVFKESMNECSFEHFYVRVWNFEILSQTDLFKP